MFYFLGLLLIAVRSRFYTTDEGIKQPFENFFSLSPSRSLPNSARPCQAQHVDNRTVKPIDYFSEYFSLNTWVEIASCTNKLSKMPNPVTCREVARFVGIHIAMGTLKVCIFSLLSRLTVAVGYYTIFKK